MKKNDLQIDEAYQNQEYFHTSTNAWLCLTPETMRDHAVDVGKELRMYNPVVFYASLSFWTLPVVLCTRLCEPCPKRLPPLCD